MVCGKPFQRSVLVALLHPYRPIPCSQWRVARGRTSRRIDAVLAEQRKLPFRAPLRNITNLLNLPPPHSAHCSDATINPPLAL